jgi:hypothetical protein
MDLYAHRHYVVTQQTLRYQRPYVRMVNLHLPSAVSRKSVHSGDRDRTIWNTIGETTRFSSGFPKQHRQCLDRTDSLAAKRSRRAIYELEPQTTTSERLASSSAAKPPTSALSALADCFVFQGSERRCLCCVGKATRYGST